MTDSTLVFYTNPMSRGRIVRWMLEETGAPYTTNVVEYGEQMNAPSYLGINPMAKVPAIVHGKSVVTETAAICTYLADAFPDTQLAPDVSNRAAYYRWLFFAAGPLEAAMTNRSLGVELTTEQSGTAGYGSYERVLDVLEDAVRENEFIAGDSFSAADIYVGSQIGFGLQFGSIEKRKTFEDYFARLSARPAWERANELDNQLMS